MIAYGMIADTIDEYLKFGKTTILECPKKYCEGIIGDTHHLLAKAEER
jgi:hypothetical protein